MLTILTSKRGLDIVPSKYGSSGFYIHRELEIHVYLSVSVYPESKIYISCIDFNIPCKVKSGLSNFRPNHYTRDHNNIYIRTDYYIHVVLLLEMLSCNRVFNKNMYSH